MMQNYPKNSKYARIKTIFNNEGKGVFWVICQYGRQYDSKKDKGNRENAATH